MNLPALGQSRLPHAKRFWAPLVVAGGLSALVAGCGSTPTTVSAPKQPTTPPSRVMVKHLISKSQSIVKTATLHFAGSAPEEIVVSTASPKTQTSVLGSLRVSTVSWDRQSGRWALSWQSPVFALQRQYQPSQALLPAVSSFKVNQNPHGALVGVLDPASIGATTLWNDGLLMWIAPHHTPKILWTAQGNHAVADGKLTSTGRSIRVSQDACGGVEAVRTGARGTFKVLSCTDITAETAGKRILFTANRNGQGVQPAQSAVTVTQGTTLVFWPANAATAKLVNRGILGLYGGTSTSAGEVILDVADTLPQWSYQFTQPGTYQFAIVPNTTALSVPATITVTVTG